jgi:hypothetical protein
MTNARTRERTGGRTEAEERRGPAPVPGSAAARGERLPDDRGQSSVVGLALMLSLVMIGASVVVVFGGQAIRDTRASATDSRAEQAMTAFDSDVAVVALGDAQTRRTQLSDGRDGRYVVDESAGWMRVTHHNYSGAGNVEVLYNGTLGSVEYRNDDTTIGYQGGGVWRKNSNGGVRMVSSPEFYYRGATLTLPVIQVRGDGGANARPVASISRTSDVTRSYPNETSTYPTGRSYQNPVLDGRVNVTVHSEYYEAWADYFRSRTTGDVTVDHANRETTVQLIAPGVVGAFRLPTRTNSLDIDAISTEHGVDQFNVSLDRGNNANNMYFSFYVDKPNEEWETVIHVPGGIGGNPCNDGTLTDDNPDDLEMDMYYYNATTGERHMWTNGSIPPLSGPVKMRCDGGEITVDIDYTSSMTMTYGPATTTNNDAFWHHEWEGTMADPASFNHSSSPNEPVSYDPDDAESLRQTTLDHLINHYFALLGPEFDLAVDYGPGGSPRIDPGNSFGVLDYDRGDTGYYITFLHVTENRVRIELE